jgi:hypothetical protein
MGERGEHPSLVTYNAIMHGHIKKVSVRVSRKRWREKGCYQMYLPMLHWYMVIV